MARKVTSKLYLSAFLITATVFVLGLLLGMVIEGYRISYIEENEREQRVNFASLQLQYLYLNSLGETERCPAFTATLNDYIKSNDRIRVRLEDYINRGLSHSEDFNLLKREYVISQLNYFILARQTRQFCDTDYVVVLFFHKRDCPYCEDQGFVLDYLKKLFGDRLLVFAFDEEFDEEPMIAILRKTYGIEDAPFVVVEDERFAGFASKETLLETICSYYEAAPEGCPGAPGDGQ